MADDNPGTVNDQITDSVILAQVLSSGTAAAQSMGMLDAVMAETLGMAMHNAVNAQQNMQMVSSAAVTATCSHMLRGQPVIEVTPPMPIVPPDEDTSEDINEIERDVLQKEQAAEAAVAGLVDDRARVDQLEAEAKSSQSSENDRLNKLETTIESAIENIAEVATKAEKKKKSKKKKKHAKKKAALAERAFDEEGDDVPDDDPEALLGTRHDEP
ncbi:MAG: RebB family R body protein [Acidobacteriota bacterium]